MAISHVKTNGVADFTGTVTVFNSQGSTTTAAATDLLRPSDWNSVHNQYSTLSGNTVNSSALSGTNIVLQGGNNITLSGTTAAGAATVVISGPNTVAQSVQPVAVSGSNGSFAFSTVTFGNSNGLSFFSSNGSMVGSYTVPTQTVESQTLGVSNLGNTVGTSGVASGGQVRMLFAGGNNITLSQSLNGASGTITISGPNTVAQTNQTLGLYASSQTTAQSSSSTVDARSLTIVGQGNISVGLSGGSFIISQTGGGAQSNQTLGLYASSQTTGQSSSTTVDARSLTVVGQGGISVGFSGGSLLVSQTGGGGQSNQTLGGYFTGNTTGQSSSSTYDARSVSISALGGVSAGMSGGMQIISGPAVSSLVAGNNASLSSNGSTVSINAMAAAVSIGGNSTSAGAGYSNVSSGTLVLAGGNNITLSQNGATVTISAAAGGGGATLDFWEPYMAYTLQTLSQPSQSTGLIWHEVPPNNVSASFLRMLALGVSFNSTSFASTANTTFSYNQQATQYALVYTRGAGANSTNIYSVSSTTFSSRFSVNVAYGSASNTQQAVTYGLTFYDGNGSRSLSASYSTSNLSTMAVSSGVISLWTGSNFVDWPFPINLSAGSEYWIAIQSSSAQTTQGTANLSNVSLRQNWAQVPASNIAFKMLGAQTNSSFQLRPGQGSYSSGGAVMSYYTAMEMSRISNNASHMRPYIQYAGAYSNVLSM